MNAGDTFFVQQVGKLYDSHLWMVLSDPALNINQVLIVSLTTRGRDDDSACILNVGDHPFVRQKSFALPVFRGGRRHPCVTPSVCAAFGLKQLPAHTDGVTHG